MDYRGERPFTLTIVKGGRRDEYVFTFHGKSQKGYHFG